MIKKDFYAQLESRWTALQKIRGPFDTLFEEIRSFISPNVPSFTGSSGTKTPQPSEVGNIYDGTAIKAAETLANGLFSDMVNPVGRWFNVGPDNELVYRLPQDAREYLDLIGDIMYKELGKAESQFKTAANQSYLEMVRFSVGPQSIVYDKNRNSVVFKHYPLAACLLDVNYLGEIDTVFRKETRTTRQIVQEFIAPGGGNKGLPKDFHNEPSEKEWTLIHSVYPRKERNIKAQTPENKPWASVWWLLDGKTDDYILRVSGFDYFPYLFPRWSINSEGVYGHPPAFFCLPEIRVLNELTKEILTAAQMANRPPFVFQNEGFFTPMKFVPGGVIMKEEGAENPFPMHTGSDPRVSLELLQAKQEAVNRCFYIDLLFRPKKKERQTIAEISDDREEQLRQMGAIITQLESGYLSKVVKTTYFLLQANGRLPPIPQSLEEFLPMDISFVSPAFRAQLFADKNQVLSTLERLLPLAQIDPAALDPINIPRLSRYLLRGVRAEVLNSDEELEALKQQREQERQASLIEQTAEPATNALKNVAQAQEMGVAI